MSTANQPTIGASPNSLDSATDTDPNALILNDATFGRLDDNPLGY